ncbi:MAG: HEAT repeat domain-containing protein, partial [Terriglobales bacterium]
MALDTGRDKKPKYTSWFAGIVHFPLTAAFLACIAGLAVPQAGVAQVSYVARFALEKSSFLQGEPLFCQFTIRNTGTQAFAFSYRTPSRALNPELEAEPRFSVRDLKGRALPDPAPRPCGGAKGTTVYGSVRLPPGQTHTERWLLNQWARFSITGRYRVRAERRLPLLAYDVSNPDSSRPPAAYALAINELALEISPSTSDDLQKAFQPYLKTLEKPAGPQAEEALLVLATLPHPFALERLSALARAPAVKRGLDRQQALEGLARLGTPEAWAVILKIAQGTDGGDANSKAAAKPAEDSLRAYAVLLLGEKGNAAFVSPLLEMLPAASEPLRSEILRTLGLFHDSRANQALFEALRSPTAT